MKTVSSVKVRKRPKSYAYYFDIVENGKRKRYEKAGFPDKVSAFDAGVEAYKLAKNNNICSAGPEITLNEFLASWMDNACRVSVKDTTWYLYRSMIEHHIKEQIGSNPLRDLTPAMIDFWIQKMVKEGLAYKTISLVLAILRKSLNYAVYPGQLIAVNPASFVTVPRTAPKDIIQRTIISPKKMADLMEKFPAGHFARIPTMLLYHTGMRIGEVIGLTWDDIDLDAGTLSICQQVRYITDLHAHYIRTPKTNAGTRTIYIDPVLIRELEAWKAQQEAAEEADGNSYIYNYRCTSKDERDKLVWQSKCLPSPDMVRENLVCTKANGAVVTPDVLRWQLRQEGLNSHSFRHTQATILVENGATPKGVAGRLGQASVLLAQNLYAHDTQKLRQDTANIFYENSGRE